MCEEREASRLNEPTIAMNYVLLMTMTTMNSISTILSSIVADLIHLNAMYDEDCGDDRLEQPRASTERMSKQANERELPRSRWSFRRRSRS